MATQEIIEKAEEGQQGLTQHEKIMLSTTDIAKLVRKQLKAEFPTSKFSVVIEYYAGGSSISIALMKTDVKVVADYNTITDWALQRLGTIHTREDIKRTQEASNHQLNKFTLVEDYDP